MSKLSDVQREEIKELLKEGIWSMRKIADLYDVTLGAICTIKYRKE